MQLLWEISLNLEDFESKEEIKAQDPITKTQILIKEKIPEEFGVQTPENARNDFCCVVVKGIQSKKIKNRYGLTSDTKKVYSAEAYRRLDRKTGTLIRPEYFKIDQNTPNPHPNSTFWFQSIFSTMFDCVCSIGFRFSKIV